MQRIVSSPQFLVVIMVLAIPIIAIISYYVHEILKTRSNNELKQSMVERGLSARDIETVINAGSKSGKKNHNRAEHGDR